MVREVDGERGDGEVKVMEFLKIVSAGMVQCRGCW